MNNYNKIFWLADGGNEKDLIVKVALFGWTIALPNIFAKVDNIWKECGV